MHCMFQYYTQKFKHVYAVFEALRKNKMTAKSNSI